MSIESMLQKNKYRYTSRRDTGDKPNKGLLEQIKVDKNETYEVVQFIETLLRKHGKAMTSANVHAAEDALHHFSAVTLRDALYVQVASYLRW